MNEHEHDVAMGIANAVRAVEPRRARTDLAADLAALLEEHGLTFSRMAFYTAARVSGKEVAKRRRAVGRDEPKGST